MQPGPGLLLLPHRPRRELGFHLAILFQDLLNFFVRDLLDHNARREKLQIRSFHAM